MRICDRLRCGVETTALDGLFSRPVCYGILRSHCGSEPAREDDRSFSLNDACPPLIRGGQASTESWSSGPCPVFRLGPGLNVIKQQFDRWPVDQLPPVPVVNDCTVVQDNHPIKAQQMIKIMGDTDQPLF